MLRGIYANAQAMTALMAKQDVQSNNLANVNTTGFKKDRVNFEEFSRGFTGPNRCRRPLRGRPRMMNKGPWSAPKTPSIWPFKGTVFSRWKRPKGPATHGQVLSNGTRKVG
jgi:hypothetical protein